jgi:hypothetical protein
VGPRSLEYYKVDGEGKGYFLRGGTTLHCFLSGGGFLGSILDYSMRSSATCHAWREPRR